MPNTHHTITEYPPPVLRAPSPPSSIGSERLPGFEDPDSHLSQVDFERKVTDTLGLQKQRKEEIDAEIDPLVPKYSTAIEEEALYRKAMSFLRKKVAEIVDDELVDRTLLRGSQVGMEPQPSSSDIDSIMRSMMGTSLSQNTNVTTGPWITSMSKSPSQLNVADGSSHPNGSVDITI